MNDTTIHYRMTIERDNDYLVVYKIDAHSLREAKAKLVAEQGVSESQILNWEYDEEKTNGEA